MSAVEKRLASLNIKLPAPAKPIANYVAIVKTGNLLMVSGQLCLGADGKLADAHKGKVGKDVSIDIATEAAKLCAINLLAQIRGEIENLDLISRCVRLGGFINVEPNFTAIAAVMNGASDFMVKALGKEVGVHCRSTVGVASLPLDAVVEVEGIFEVRA